MFPIRDLEPGDKVTTADGSEYEVLENPQDGYWLVARDLSTSGPDEDVFAGDIVSAATTRE